MGIVLLSSRALCHNIGLISRHYVYSIVENGPAASSDLQERDIITALEGTGVSSMDELQTQLSYYAGGTTVELTVQRLVDGQYQEQTISVTLGYRSDYQSGSTNGSTQQ